MVHENFTIDKFYILVNLVVCLLMFLGIRLSQNYKHFFGKCVSNEKPPFLTGK